MIQDQSQQEDLVASCNHDTSLVAQFQGEDTTTTKKVVARKLDRIFDAKDKVQEEATVDEMKIQTMYKMVEDVSVRVQGKEVVKKVLY